MVGFARELLGCFTLKVRNLPVLIHQGIHTLDFEGRGRWFLGMYPFTVVHRAELSKLWRAVLSGIKSVTSPPLQKVLQI